MTTGYQYYPRYVPGSPARIDADTVSTVVAAERKAYEQARTEPVLSDAFAKAARYGLRGIVLRIKQTAEGWHVADEFIDVHDEMIQVLPFEKGDKAEFARGVLLFAKFRRDLLQPQNHTEQLYAMRTHLIGDAHHALGSLRTLVGTLKARMKFIDLAVEAEVRGESSSLSSTGEIQALGPQIDVACANFKNAKERVASIEALIETRDPNGHYTKVFTLPPLPEGM